MVCPTPLVGEKSFSEEKECIGRRQLLSYLVANPTLTIAARWGLDEPSVKKPADVAIMAETFGQALDGQEAIKASYNKWEAP